jgi:hypothetical protein
MVYPPPEDGSSPPYLSNGDPACIFGIGPASVLDNGPLLLGDTFLRSAYVVYDLANYRIGLAQTKFNSTDSNVAPFPSLNASIPSATTVADEVPVTETASKGVIGRPTPPASIVATSGLNVTSALYTGAAGPAFASATAATTVTATKKSVAGARPNPIAWEQIALVGLTMGLLGMGTGVFFWL